MAIDKQPEKLLPFLVELIDRHIATFGKRPASIFLTSALLQRLRNEFPDMRPVGAGVPQSNSFWNIPVYVNDLLPEGTIYLENGRPDETSGNAGKYERDGNTTNKRIIQASVH